MTDRRGSATVGLGSKQIQGLSVEQVQQSLLRLFPDHQDFVKEHLIKPFCLSDEDCHSIQTLFEENLARGLSRETHASALVKMYQTYVRQVPNGEERGRYLALDFGGVYFRVVLMTIDESGISTENKTGVIPNKMLDESGEKLFNYIAVFLHRFLKQHDLLSTTEPVPLGFCFSFPFEPLALNRGRLVHWAKHFHCEGVVGHEVVGLLEAAIKKKGEMNIDCTSMISDTVGTLMAGAVQDSRCSIGLILGKGTNACYFESTENVGTWNGDHDDPKQVIINTEWRSFGDDGCLDKFRSEYDFAVDKECKHRGTALYEKMVSSTYLGEGVRLCLQRLHEEGLLFDEHWTAEMGTPWKFYTKYISEVLSEENIRFQHTRHVYDDLHAPQVSELECRTLHHVCQLATVRSATLTAIGLACLMNRMGRKEVGIAVDGSLFRFHPVFTDTLTKTIPNFLKNDTKVPDTADSLFTDTLTNIIPKFLKKDTKFWFVQAADGSGKGAALTSAVARRLLTCHTDNAAGENKDTASDTMQTSEAQSGNT